MSWLEYFFKWFLEATPIPVRIAEVVFFLLTLIGLATKDKLAKRWRPIMQKLVWQLPLAILLTVLFISLSLSSYNLYQKKVEEVIKLEDDLRVARKQAYPPITTLMMQQHFKNKDIPLGELALVSSGLVNKTFEDCRIYGPVVIYPKEPFTLIYCNFNADSNSVFIATTNESVTGVLLVEGCKFIGCSFYNVSFIGSEEIISMLKTTVESTQRQ